MSTGEVRHKRGNIAGDARKKLEVETRRKVITSENYLDATEKKKRIDAKKTKTAGEEIVGFRGISLLSER